MTRLMILLTAAIAAGGIGLTARADINPNVGGDAHAHADTTTGKIVTYRVQTQGLEYGKGDDRLDAEAVVKLDSAPDMAFGIRYHDQAQPATAAMIDLLLEAYMHDMPVTIFHTEPPGRKNVQILWVEVSH